MARRFLLLMALLLTACGPDGGKEPFTDSRAPPSLSPRFFPPEGWTWGLVQAGDFPAQRYGVSAPATGTTAHVLILPGYGETAEAWFETTRSLNDRGYIVWVLEGAGQGGSGRFALPRDVGHVPSLEPDLLAVKTMLRVVIPDDGRPVVLLGSQAGAVTALLAGEKGLAGDGVIASAPLQPADAQPYDEILGRIGLAGMRIPGEPGWARDRPYRTGTAPGEPFRAGVQQAWQQANPDLRMGGPSLGRRLVMARGWSEALTGLARAPGPTLLIGAPDGLAAACHKAPGCRAVAFPEGAAGPYGQLEADAPRTAWLALVEEFVRQRVAARLAATGLAPDHGV